MGECEERQRDGAYVGNMREGRDGRRQRTTWAKDTAAERRRETESAGLETVWAGQGAGGSGAEGLEDAYAIVERGTRMHRVSAWDATTDFGGWAGTAILSTG